MTNTERDKLLIRMSGQIGAIEKSLRNVEDFGHDLQDHEKRITTIENSRQNEHSTRSAVFRLIAWVVGVGMGLVALVLQFTRNNGS